ncbi:hypothetical protein J6590_037134 [Homalodisca vitripennis]|nr:hypothetical protein J6590_037134 [Homalodisca vitripennis]
MNTSPSSMCPECGKPVEIFNGDVKFSVELHRQSHKSLETISQDMAAAQLKPKTRKKYKENICSECNEHFDILNNDLTLSYQLHAQKHKTHVAGNYLKNVKGMHFASGSNKVSDSENRLSKKIKIKIGSSEKNQVPQSERISVLDALFEVMPSDLQDHKGFISNSDINEVFCIVCKVRIGSIVKVTKHLKTRLHEDQIINSLKEKLPENSCQVMEFVTFHRSKLSCNFCRCEITMNPCNPHETIVNIVSHNATEKHQRQIAASGTCSSEALVTVNTYALMNPLIHKNKDLIEYTAVHKFKCNLCNKNINYNKNVSKFMESFICHFESVGHKKLEAISAVELFGKLHIVDETRHKFIASKGSILCIICNCSVDVNIQKLFLHTKENAKNELKNSIESLSKMSSVMEVALNNSHMRCTDLTGNSAKTCIDFCPSHPVEIQPGVATNNRIIKTSLTPLPDYLKRINIDCLIENDQGEIMCLDCSCAIPSNLYNIESHLLSKNHMKRSKKNESSQTQNYNLNLDGGVSKTLKDNASLIKHSFKYFFKFNDKYKCNICDGIIDQTSDENSLRMNILRHISGKKHLEKYQQELVYKLFYSDEIVGVNRSVLKINNTRIVCTLCDYVITSSTNEDTLKTSIISHLTGCEHKNKKVHVHKGDSPGSIQNQKQEHRCKND